MKLIVLGLALLCYSACAQDKKGETLLGADGLDEKMAEKLAGKQLIGADDLDKKVAMEQQPVVHKGDREKKVTGKPIPQTPDDIKEKLKEDRRLMKNIKQQVTQLKNRIHDKSLAKNEKKQLKAEYSSLRRDLREKKHEIKGLKMMKKETQKGESQRGGRRKGGRKGGRSKHNKKGFKKMENRKTLKENTAAEEVEPDSEEVTKEERKAQRKQIKKQQRKQAKRKNRKSMMIVSEDELTGQTKKRGKKHGGQKKLTGFVSDMPVLRSFSGLPLRGGHGKHKKVSCEQDSDCKDGESCKLNRKGMKFCRRPRKKRPAGKRCRHSHQCAEDLKCFVPNQAIVAMTGSKKKHNKRGMCMSPASVDPSLGHFAED